MSVTIYHNPRCSKSRQTLQLLTERHVANLPKREADVLTEVVEYLQTPPSHEELERILTMLGLEPRALMRTKETEYEELGLDNPTLDRAALIEAMVQHPRLIERPIVIHGNKAAIGRPPEKILEIL